MWVSSVSSLRTSSLMEEEVEEAVTMMREVEVMVSAVWLRSE